MNSPILVECLGWTLLHFLWQGLLIAALLAACLRLLRPAAANHRYLAGCCALLLLAAAPAITFPRILRQHQLPPAALQTPILSPISAPPLSIQSPLPPQVVVAQLHSRNLNFSQRLETFLPWLVLAWLVGVFIFSLRLLTAWLQVRRLTRVATTALDDVWHRQLAELAHRLGLSRPVRLLQSALVAVPTVIGWLRPVILLPASCLVGLTAAQLESILAHELAHIRRHDYLVNLLQSVVETFLFYHPAVWWISRQVREEREHCCDDLAVETCGDRLAYARALATLEELRHTPAQLALAAGGAPLLPRIRRLAGQSAPRPQRPAWPVAGVMAIFLILGLTTLLHNNRAEARDGETIATNATPANQPQPRSTNSPAPHNVSSITGRKAIRAKLESIKIATLQYDAAPLAQVVNDLVGIAKTNDPDQIGINFLIDREPGSGNDDFPDSVTVTINHPLHNLRLVDALDAIRLTADHPIYYSVLDYGVVFHSGNAGETRVYQVDPNTFQQGLQGVVGVPFGNTSGNSGGNGGNSGGSQGTGTLVPRVNAIEGINGVTGGKNASSAPNNSPVPETHAVPPSPSQPFAGSFAESPPTNSEPLETRTFHIDSNILGEATDEISDGSQTNHTPQLQRRQTQIRQFLTSIGVDFSTNSLDNIGKMFVWNERTRTLMLRSTHREIELLDASLARMASSAPEVNLVIKFVEVKKSGFLGWVNSTSSSASNQTPPPQPPLHSTVQVSSISPSASNQVVNTLTGVLTPPQYQLALAALEQRAEVPIIYTAKVTTADGREVQLRIEQKDPAMPSNLWVVVMPGGLKNPMLGTSNTPPPQALAGPVLDLMPIIGADGHSVSINLFATTPEHATTSTQPYVGDFPEPGQTGPSRTQKIPTPPLAIVMHYSQAVSNHVTVLDGQTAVMSIPGGNLTHDPNKTLLIFITPTIINPDGTRKNPASTNQIPPLSK